MKDLSTVFAVYCVGKLSCHLFVFDHMKLLEHRHETADIRLPRADKEGVRSRGN